MGTTTKMAIPYPEATGLVKDGWEDMKDIADQVDAKSGLVLLNTTSFSGVSSISLPTNTFNSNFTNYHIKYNLTTSANTTVNLRLRASGSDITTSNYDVRGFYVGFTSALTRVSQSSLSQWDILGVNTNKAMFHLELSQPNVAASKINFAKMYSNSSGDMVDYAIIFNTTTIADSLSLYPSSGTVTGSVWCYGYNA